MVVVVDQPGTIGALPVTIARAMTVDAAYAGNAKTDARDAYVIAESARSMSHALRHVDVGDEAMADLEVIVGFDDDLAPVGWQRDLADARERLRE